MSNTVTLNYTTTCVLFQTCACYYPVQAGSQTYGPFTIETVALDSTFPDITVRDMTLAIGKKVSGHFCEGFELN